MPDTETLWRAVDQFRLGVIAGIGDYLARDARTGGAAPGPSQRTDDLADVRDLRPPLGHRDAAARPRGGRRPIRRIPCSPPARSSRKPCDAPFVASPRPAPARHDFVDVIEIARIARLRVRRTLVARRLVDAGCRSIAGLAWRATPPGCAAPRRRPSPRLHHDRAGDGDAPSARPLAGDGTRPRSRHVLPGAAGAPAWIPRSGRIFVSPFEGQWRPYCAGCRHDRRLVAGGAVHHQCPDQFRHPAHRTRPAGILRARACRDRDIDGRRSGDRGDGDAQGRGPDRLASCRPP